MKPLKERHEILMPLTGNPAGGFRVHQIVEQEQFLVKVVDGCGSDHMPPIVPVAASADAGSSEGGWNRARTVPGRS